MCTKGNCLGFLLITELYKRKLIGLIVGYTHAEKDYSLVCLIITDLYKRTTVWFAYSSQTCSTGLQFACWSQTCTQGLQFGLPVHKDYSLVCLLITDLYTRTTVWFACWSQTCSKGLQFGLPVGHRLVQKDYSLVSLLVRLVQKDYSLVGMLVTDLIKRFTV